MKNATFTRIQKLKRTDLTSFFSFFEYIINNFEVFTTARKFHYNYMCAELYTVGYGYYNSISKRVQLHVIPHVLASSPLTVKYT